MSESLVLVCTPPTSVPEVSTRISPLDFSTTSTSGLHSSVTVSTRPRKCLPTTASGSSV